MLPKKHHVNTTNYQNKAAYTQHRKNLDWIGQKLGIQKQSDWYALTGSDVRRVGGDKLLAQFNGSLAHAVQTSYPEFHWNSLLFTKLPKKYWSVKQNHRKFFDWIADQLSINTQEEWFGVVAEDIKELGGHSSLSHYKGSLLGALSSVYPEYEWNPFKSNNLPKHFWDDKDNHRKFFDWMAEMLEIHEQLEWYGVLSEEVKEIGGGGLLSHYQESLFGALQSSYPEYEWSAALFNIFHRPNKESNHRDYFDWLSEQLGIQTQDEWYSVEVDDVRFLSGENVLKYYSESLLNALEKVYSEYEWNCFKLGTLPKDFWTKKHNHRKFFDWCAEELQIQSQEEWALSPLEDLPHFNELFSTYYHNNLHHALSSVYPEFQWNPKHFDVLEIQRRSMDEVAQSLGITYQHDWYSFTGNDIKRQTRAEVLSHFNGSLFTALTVLYPQFEWNPALFQTSKKHFFSKKINHRKAFDLIAEKLNIEQQHQWYEFSFGEICSVSPFNVNAHYDSLMDALQEIYPEFDWSLILFTRGKNNHRQVFDWVAEQLDIRTQLDWYDISGEDVKRVVGLNVLGPFGGSIFTALEKVYPEYDWNPLLQTVNSRHFKHGANHRRLFDRLAEVLKIETQEGWFNISGEDLRRISGHNVLQSYDGSILKALSTVYPEFHWNPLMFSTFPRHFLNDRESHRTYLDLIAEHLGLVEQDDWYSLTAEDVQNIVKLPMYNNSLLKALETCYGEFDWQPHMFHNLRENFWEIPSNLRRYFDWLAVELDIRVQSDWYRVTPEDVMTHYGPEISSNSTGINPVISKLQLSYPEFIWFTLADAENQRLYLEHIAESFRINKMEDWLNISKSHLIRVAGPHASRLLSLHNMSWIKTLKTLFPEFDRWPESTHSSKGQSSVIDVLKKIIGNHHIHENFKLMNNIELDVFVPSLSLAFEYQGAQHYSTEFQRKFDAHKVDVCKSRGITLIEVPYWWQASPASLIRSIQLHRPELKLSPSLELRESNSRTLFPEDISLDEVREAIQVCLHSTVIERAEHQKGISNFNEISKDGFIVFDCADSIMDVYPNPSAAPNSEVERQWKIRRECRGLKFSSETHQIISRPFHRFLSVAESESYESRLCDIEVISYKYDGVMVTPIIMGNDIKFVTRNGDTLSNPWVDKITQQYAPFMRAMIENNSTPIFEYCSPRNRKIVPYSVDAMILTGIRNNSTGEYVTHEDMKKMSSEYNISIADVWDGSITSWKQLQSILSAHNKAEGFVIKFRDGTFLKVKTQWYYKYLKLKQQKLFKKQLAKKDQSKDNLHDLKGGDC